MKESLVNKEFVTNIVSKKMYDIRVSFNLTQQELGKILNVDQSTIASIETGRREIRIKELYLLASKLNVNINWLLSLSDKKLDASAQSKHIQNIKKLEK